MIANLFLEENCERDLELLAHRDLLKVIAALEFLCHNPLSA